jgi:tetratricopeptide (TPR) repeat protein
MKKRESLNQIVRYFVDNGGAFFIVSQDDMFVRMFKGFIKALRLADTSMHHDPLGHHFIREIRRLLDRFTRVIVFVEATLEGRNNTPYFRHIKDILDDRVTIICLCNESGRDTLSLFRERGADNTMVKPVSIDTIVKKIAFSIKPNNFSMLVSKAKKAIGRGNFTTGRVIAQEILKANPESTIAHILLGDIHRRQKEFDVAELCYRKASQNARMHLQPLERLVELYGETGRLTDQLNVLKLMDKISPLNYERKVSLGDVYAQLGEKSLSVGCYEEALRLVNMQTREMISYARMQVGTRLKQVDALQSLSYMKEAIELKGDDLRPSDLWMFNEIGCFLQKKGQWQEAAGYYEQALEIVPDDWGMTYHLAMAHFQGKQYQKAREYVEKALDHYPELLNLCADIPYNIAMIYYKLAQYAEASQYAKIACINDHDHAPARRLLSELKQRCLKRSGGNTRECTMYEDVPEPRS